MNLTQATGPSFSYLEMGFNLLLALALTLVITVIYRKTHKGFGFSQSLMISMVGSAGIVCMVIMAISSNIALSLGLVGSLSVIRFRTAIKDPKEMIYLFFSIAIGLACGSGSYSLALTGTAIIGLAMGILSLTRHTAAGSDEFLLTFQAVGGSLDLERFQSTLSRFCSFNSMRSTNQIADSDLVEYSYAIRFRRQQTPESFFADLRAMDSVQSVSLLSPEANLIL